MERDFRAEGSAESEANLIKLASSSANFCVKIRTKVKVIFDKRYYIPIMAKVVDIRAWRAIPNLKRGSEIQSNSGEWIVTGRIPLSDVESVLPKVKSLDLSQRLNPNYSK